MFEFFFISEMILSPTESSQSSIGGSSNKAAPSNASSSSTQPSTATTTATEPPVCSKHILFEINKSFWKLIIDLIHLQQPSLLTKPRLQELVREIDPTEQLDEDVEELLLQIADDFVENTVNIAGDLFISQQLTYW